MPENPPTNDNLESQLDALMAEMAAPGSVSENAPDGTAASPGDALIDQAVDTALQSQDPPAPPPEVSQVAPEEVADASEELAAAKSQTPEAPETQTQDATENQAEAAVDRATDLASQLDALIEAPAPAADAAPQDSEEPDAPATPPKPSPEQSLPQDDEDPALATATEEPLDKNEDPNEDDALQGDFVSEAEMISRVDTQLEAQAKEQIKADATDDFSELAGMLGVEATELAEVPAAPPEETEHAEPDELDTFDGAFQSPDDLLAESVAADAPGNFEQDDEDELEDFAFATPEEVLNEAPEEESWYDPPPPQEVEAPDLAAKQDDHTRKQKLTASPTPETEVEVEAEPAAAKTEPKPAKKSAAAGPKASPWKPHIDRACAAGRRLRPYLAQMPHTTVFLAKAGCYYANAPVDFLANRLAKDDKPAMPLKSWVGLAGAAVLIPGTLLVLVGLLT